MNLQRVFLWTMIGSLSIAALLGLWAVLMSTFGPLQQEVLFTSVLLGVYSIPAFACAYVLNRHRMKSIMWIGLVTAALALAVWLLMIWIEIRLWDATWELLFKGGWSATIATVWAAHFGLLMMLRLVHPGANVTRIVTLIAAGTLGGLLLLVIWIEDVIPEEMWRVYAVLTILTSCGTLATPILGIMEMLKARSSSESVPAKIIVEMTCPRCGARQHVPAGGGRCESCRLLVEVRIEEPRCTCGYLLHKLTGEICPECGRTIPEADRWYAAKQPEISG